MKAYLIFVVVDVKEKVLYGVKGFVYIYIYI